MRLTTPLTTFGDLAADGLAIEVSCPNCGNVRSIDGKSPRIRDRRIAGARFRCQACGSGCTQESAPVEFGHAQHCSIIVGSVVMSSHLPYASPPAARTAPHTSPRDRPAGRYTA